jgi:hypothetical protein
MITGGCLCGAIRFEIEADPIGGGFCYCRDCQIVAGGAPGAVMAFPRTAYRDIGRPPSEYRSVSDAGVEVVRLFCPNCGTHISARNDRRADIIPIRVGVLDDPGVFRPQANLWLRSAQPWHTIDQGLPGFETQPG